MSPTQLVEHLHFEQGLKAWTQPQDHPPGLGCDAVGVSLANGQSPALPLIRAELLAHCEHPDKEKTPEPLAAARGQSKRDLVTIEPGWHPALP